MTHARKFRRAVFLWLGCAISVCGAWGPTTSARANSDSELWLSAGLQYRVNKRVRLNFEQQLRLDQTMSRVSKVIPELSVAYRPIKQFQVGFGYRYEYARSGGTFEDRHRLHVDASLRGGAGPVDMEYRMRFQERLRSDKGSLETRHTIRQKVGLDVDTNTPITPEVSTEAFLLIADKSAVELTTQRVTAGIGYEIGDNDLELAYRVEIPIAHRSDPLVHILLVGYRYTVKRKK